jgi:hypothetical protein
MTKVTTKPDSLQPATELAVDLFDNWIDPIETEVRARARQFIEELIRGELDAALARPRYGALRPKFGPPAIRVFRLCHDGGLVAPSRLSNEIGVFCPIAPWGRSSL